MKSHVKPRVLVAVAAAAGLLAAAGAPPATAEIGGVILATPHDGPAPAPAGPAPTPVGEGYVDPGENFVGIAPDTGPGSVAPDLLPPTNMTVFVPGSPSDPNWAGYVVPGAVGGTPLTQLDPNELARMNLKQLALL